MSIEKLRYLRGKLQDGTFSFIDISSELIAINFNHSDKALLEEIKTSFKSIRIDELVIAFKNGARGEFGEFFGLSVVTFNKWINGHQISEKRREALKSIRDAEKVEVKQPSKQEALKMFLEM